MQIAVAGAVGRGAVTPGEGFALSQMIEAFLRAIDASDFETRLQEVERKQAASASEHYVPAIGRGWGAV